MADVSQTLTDPLLGRVIDGRYEVRVRVAAGGMATVYVAFDRHLERDVALKVMHRHLDADPRASEFAARFRREAKAAARLTHPGIVRVYDQGADGEISYLTMEYVDGENLREHLARNGPMPLGDTLTLIEQVLDALASAHRQGLVHQDVKPENVLLDGEGRPRVADFGLARAVTEVTASTSGTILGTVAYLGPELINSGRSDARTDVYAVGVMLYEALTGRQPYTGESAVAVATQHVHHDMPVPSTVVPWLPAEVDNLVAVFTRRNPDDRPADAAAALTLVREARANLDEPTLARKANPPSGSLATIVDSGATTVFTPTPPGATVVLPVGAGHPFAAVGAELTALPEDDPEAREPHRTDRRAGWWIAAIIIAVLALGGGGLWWYQSIGPGAYTTVPPVTGEPEDTAIAFLTSVGLDHAIERAFDDDVPAGFVISTDPEAQQRIENGGTVSLMVSKGPLMYTVPEVVGGTTEDARDILEEVGFEVGDSESEHSDTEPAGTVLSVSPAEGEVVRHDRVITLTVSDGPAPIVVPAVTGLAVDEAIAILEEDYAMDVSVVRERTDKADKGIVFAQDPGADADSTRTAAITLTVSDGPPLVTVDDYVGMAVAAAEKAAKKAGLKVDLYGVWPWSSKNLVVEQSVFPGTQVEKGTSITLRYN